MTECSLFSSSSYWPCMARTNTVCVLALAAFHRSTICSLVTTLCTMRLIASVMSVRKVAR